MGSEVAGPSSNTGVQASVARLSAFALTPEQQNAIAKTAVDVHKQVLEGLKTPSEIEKNLGVAEYYRSNARLHDYQRSAQYVTDQIMIHAAGPMAQAEAQKELYLFKDKVMKESAAELKGQKAPPVLRMITGMDDMGDIATYFGRDNLEKLLVAGAQMQWHMAVASREKSTQEMAKLLTLHEKYNKDILALKDIPTQAQWNALDEKQKNMYRINGIQGPRTKAQEDAIGAAIAARDALGKKIWGPDYVMPGTPQTPGAILDVTPQGGAKPGAPAARTPSTPLDQRLKGNLYNQILGATIAGGEVKPEDVKKRREVLTDIGLYGDMSNL